jgi:hypothetical protein
MNCRDQHSQFTVEGRCMEKIQHRLSRRRLLRFAAALPVVVAVPAAALAEPSPARAAGRPLECLADLRVSG